MTSAIAGRVAIDIGNSAAKWSLRLPGQARDLTLHRVSLAGEHWPDQILAGVDALAGAASLQWRIAAVNRPARQRLVQRLGERKPASAVSVIGRADVPMPTKLAQPERIGIDRLLALWQATELFPRQRIVVVDAGSAITIDCASGDGEFLGGVIMPGLALQFDSLARGTDALPALQPSSAAERSVADFPVPATDTAAAIRSGILLGTAAAIDALIGRCHAGQSDQVILTGGDAARLSALLSHTHLVDDRLVIDAILATSWRG